MTSRLGLKERLTSLDTHRWKDVSRDKAEASMIFDRKYKEKKRETVLF